MHVRYQIDANSRGCRLDLPRDHAPKVLDAVALPRGHVEEVVGDLVDLELRDADLLDHHGLVLPFRRGVLGILFLTAMEGQPEAGLDLSQVGVGPAHPHPSVLGYLALADGQSMVAVEPDPVGEVAHDHARLEQRIQAPLEDDAGRAVDDLGLVLELVAVVARPVGDPEHRLGLPDHEPRGGVGNVQTGRQGVGRGLEPVDLGRRRPDLVSGGLVRRRVDASRGSGR